MAEFEESGLSQQLETSLSFHEEEETSSAEKYPKETSPVKDNQITRNLLESISALQSPIKVTLPKSSENNLRKKVLLRSMISPIKAPEDSDTLAKILKTDSDKTKDSDMVDIDNSSNKVDFTKINVDENIDIEDIKLNKNSELHIEKYIVIEEVSDNSVTINEGQKLQKDVIKVEEKPKKKSGLDVDYVSKDPLENADNNNPDWLLLQKLETDEDRYKAVRRRWRNLIVPEPNKDLTSFAWCRTNLAEKKVVDKTPKKIERETKSDEEFPNKGRKRTFSSSGVESPAKPQRKRETLDKRVRTLSCTRVYDDKIAALRRHASEECLKINYQQKSALEELYEQYLLEKRSLSNWSLNTGVSVSDVLYDLDQTHHQRQKMIQRSYDDLSQSVWEQQTTEIRTLEDASTEVLAFHRFYQGLDENAPESMALTEEQLAEIEEINSMYDAFYKFYES